MFHKCNCALFGCWENSIHFLSIGYIPEQLKHSFCISTILRSDSSDAHIAVNDSESEAVSLQNGAQASHLNHRSFRSPPAVLCDSIIFGQLVNQLGHGALSYHLKGGSAVLRTVDTTGFQLGTATFFEHRQCAKRSKHCTTDSAGGAP